MKSRADGEVTAEVVALLFLVRELLRFFSHFPLFLFSHRKYFPLRLNENALGELLKSPFTSFL